MQHTQVFNAKKEFLDFFSGCGSGTIITEVTKIFDAARSANHVNGFWDRDEQIKYSCIINAVIYFTASLTKLQIDSSTENLRGEAEIRVFGVNLEATPDSTSTENFLAIGKKLLSKFSSKEITEILWQCYFEAMVVKGEYEITRMQLASIGYTLEVVTGIISEMDVLIIRVENEVIA